MRRRCLQASLVGMLAAGMAGCGDPSSSPRGETPPRREVLTPSEVPRVHLPREAEAAELLEPLGATQLGGRSYRFRRVFIGGVPFYVPYCAPGSLPTYVPYYSNYDPEDYYVPAFAAPDERARAILVRYGRRDGSGSR